MIKGIKKIGMECKEVPIQTIRTCNADCTEGKDMDILIVYGNILGNVNNCETVVVINGDISGNMVNCNNITKLPADD